MSPAPRLLPAGDSAVVAEYGDAIDVRVNVRVRQLQRTLEALAHPGLVELVPTYRSLMVHYDPIVLSREAIEHLIAETAERLPEETREPGRTVEIPVTYGGAAGPDLADVAAFAGLKEGQVVELHASGDYTVFMLGFMPGFPYLGGLPQRHDRIGIIRRRRILYRQVTPFVFTAKPDFLPPLSYHLNFPVRENY